MICHPNRNLLIIKDAFKNNKQLILCYDLDKKKIFFKCSIPQNIKYWKWVNNNILAVVGDKSIFHVEIGSLQGFNNVVEARLVHQREGELSSMQKMVQIISYGVDSSQKFAFLVGLSLKKTDQGQSIQSSIQLTALEHNKNNFIEGYACCFAKAFVKDDFEQSNLFAYVQKDGLQGKIIITEMGRVDNKFKKQIDIVFPDGHQNDFPVYFTILSKYAIAFMFTQKGLMYLIEISEGSQLLSSQVSNSHLLVGTQLEQQNGCYVLSKDGNVISVEINDAQLIQFVQNSANIPNHIRIANKLSIRTAQPGSENLYI